MSKMRYAARRTANDRARSGPHHRDALMLILHPTRTRWPTPCGYPGRTSSHAPEERPPEEAIAPWFRALPHAVMQPHGGHRTTTRRPRLNWPTTSFTTWVISPTCCQVLKATSSPPSNETIENVPKPARASRHERLGNAMMHLIEGGGKRIKPPFLGWLVRRSATRTLDCRHRCCD